MRPDQDAYGQLILGYLERGEGIEIVERDNGFIDASRYGPAAYFFPFRRWPKPERQAIRDARGRVLDCGAGRVALHLQERGHHGSYATPWFDYLLASPEEMADLAAGTGWELRRVIDEGEHVYVGVLERVE